MKKKLQLIFLLLVVRTTSHAMCSISSGRDRVVPTVTNLFSPYIPSWEVAGSSGGNTKTGEFSSLRFTFENDPFGRPDENLVKSIFKKHVHVGNEVWEVVFKLWDKVCHYYMFVDSKKHGMVKYENLFGIDISQSHVDSVCRFLYGYICH